VEIFSPTFASEVASVAGSPGRADYRRAAKETGVDLIADPK
jgi:hypothetical protein